MRKLALLKIPLPWRKITPHLNPLPQGERKDFLLSPSPLEGEGWDEGDLISFLLTTQQRSDNLIDGVGQDGQLLNVLILILEE